MGKVHGKVVILSGVYPDMRCGVSMHVWKVAQAVAELKSWDVHVLTSDHPDIDSRRNRDFGLHPVIKRWDVWSLSTIVSEIEKLRPDVLHVQTPTAAYAGRANLTIPLLWGAMRRMRERMRLVVTQHDLAIGHWLMQRKHGMLLKRADAVTVSNDRDYQAAERLSRDLLARTHVAHLASLFSPPRFSDAERAEVRAGLGVPEGGALLTYFGFMIPSRRIEALVRAAAALRAKGTPFKLMLMGDAGPGARRYLESCKALSEQLGLADMVSWTGYVPDDFVERTMAVSDLFVSPIERGADFRNSSINVAITAGLPILTTENPRYGIDRELRAWGVCRFFDARDPSRLAQAITDLVADEEARRRMSRTCAEVASRHTWDEHARVLGRAYRGDPPEPYDPEAVAAGGAR